MPISRGFVPKKNAIRLFSNRLFVGAVTYPRGSQEMAAQKENLLLLQTNLASSQCQDFMLLFQQGGLEDAMVTEMLSKAKRKYVDARHSQKISVMHSSTYKDGWLKTYVNDGKKRKEVVRKTEDELYEALYQFYSDLEKKPITLSETFDLLVQRKTEQLNRSHNTISEDIRYFSFLSDALKKKSLADISEADLRKWIVKNYLPTKPKEAALRKMIQLINQVFSYGMRNNYCFMNPAEHICCEDYLKGCDISVKADEDRAFSIEEIDLLTQNAWSKQKNPRAVMLLLAKETGMRAGELAALHTSDITENYIHIHRQQIRDRSSGHQEFYEVGYTKDERKHPHGGRYIPINAECQKIIDLAKALPGTSDYLFHAKDGSAISKDSYELFLRRCCDSLGIQTRNNHAFRVAFNSRMIEKGLSSADRALILGHAVQTNEHHYSVTDKRRLDSIRQRLQ